MKFENIVFEKKGHTAMIAINRQKVYNAFNYDTICDLHRAFEDAIDDSSIRVIVLTGKGDHFSTGGDINWEKDFDINKGKEMISKCISLSNTMRNGGKPIIAAVRGYCIGGGNELNLLCDVTIASEKAVFGQAGPKVGSAPLWYGTQMLPRIVGEKKAREIIFWCRKYSASEAEKMGLVNKVVKDEELEEEVRKWCDEIQFMSPQAIKLSKVSMNFESDLLYPSVIHGLNMLILTYGTDEFQEGMSAFLEKRKPDYSKMG